MERDLYIKNMVCPRCLSSVKDILARLNIPFENVQLGKVTPKRELSSIESKCLQTELKKVGFELITDKHKRISSQIKTLIINGFYQDEQFGNKNLSVFLSEKLHRDYSFLSHIFSKTEGKTIQQFQADVKIMRIKELLEYDEHSISEIADLMEYGNAAYLSTQFKKATGLTPSQYNQILKNRHSLDKL